MNRLSPFERQLVLALIGLLFLIWAIGFAMGIVAAHKFSASQPVCHSITEDSVITDCDYKNGAWYRK